MVMPCSSASDETAALNQAPEKGSLIAWQYPQGLTDRQPLRIRDGRHSSPGDEVRASDADAGVAPPLGKVTLPVRRVQPHPSGPGLSRGNAAAVRVDGSCRGPVGLLTFPGLIAVPPVTGSGSCDLDDHTGRLALDTGRVDVHRSKVGDLARRVVVRPRRPSRGQCAPGRPGALPQSS
jgi:hypothetical protein